MNKIDLKLICQPPILGMSLWENHKEIISPESPDRFPQTARVAPCKSHTTARKQPQQLESMTARPSPPDSIIEPEKEINRCFFTWYFLNELFISFGKLK